MSATSSDAIVIVDISKYSIDTPDEEAEKLLSAGKVQDLAGQVIGALETRGFFLVTNHGITQEVINELRAQGKAFFTLSQDYKDKFASDFIYPHGYIPPGYERRDGFSDKFVPDFANLESFIAQIGGQFSELAFPDDTVPGFREALKAWHTATNKLGGRLLDLISVGLGLKDPRYLRSIHCGWEKNNNCLRVNYARAAPKGTVPSNVGKARLGEHKDYDTITMLSVSGPGLQGHLLNGDWVDVPPIPGAIIVQSGVALEEFSSDRIQGNFHQVVMPPPPYCYEDRYSLVNFISTYLDAPVGSLDGSGKYPPHPGRDIAHDAYLNKFCRPQQ